MNNAILSSYPILGKAGPKEGEMISNTSIILGIQSKALAPSLIDLGCIKEKLEAHCPGDLTVQLVAFPEPWWRKS